MVREIGCAASLCSQAVMTVVLAVRRVRHSDGSAFASWDNLNGLLAFGGLGTTVLSIGVTILNMSWQIDGVPRPETRSECRTITRALKALFDVGLASEVEGSTIELRTARIICFVIAFPAVPASWWWIIFIFRPSLNPLKSKALSFEPGMALVPLPGYGANAAYIIALRTAFGGLIIAPIIFLFTGSVGRIPQLRVYLLKGNDIALITHRAFDCIFTLTAVVFFVHWYVEEMGSMIVSRERGRWLEIM
jgi:hypothetical protein